MHVTKFLHKLLAPVTHLKRLITIIHLVQAALSVKRLSVTNLGRALALPIQERSCIRRTDRLIGNKKLQQERLTICATTAKLLIGNKTTAIILVDWSKVPNVKQHILRAALVARGRALTIYEEVHPEKKLGNGKVQTRFLQHLKNILPSNCEPIIVSDAGFHNGWFQALTSLGWDYVGRIRGAKRYLNAKGVWEKISSLWVAATRVPKDLGAMYLCKNNRFLTHFYLYRGKKQGRKCTNNHGKKRRDSVSVDCAKAGREPWVLVSSIKGTFAAKKIVAIYSTRMQIEEGFRDLKSSNYGLSFEHAYSKSGARIEILLLIAMLAALVAWLTGWIAESLGWQYRFQVNSVKTKRILSLFFLGCQVIKRKITVPMGLIKEAIHAV